MAVSARPWTDCLSAVRFVPYGQRLRYTLQSLERREPRRLPVCRSVCLSGVTLMYGGHVS